MVQITETNVGEPDIMDIKVSEGFDFGHKGVKVEIMDTKVCEGRDHGHKGV